MPSNTDMSKETIHILYDGEPVANGTMDVRDLSPALLSIGELCQQANYILNGDETQVSVLVKADFKKGSFGIDLEVVRTLIDSTRSLLSGETLDAAKKSVERLFGGGGLFIFLKWLRRNKEGITTTSLENGNITIEVSGNQNQIDVKPQVIKLARDPRVIKNVAQIVKPLKKPGMKKLEIKQRDRTLQTVKPEDVPYLEPDPIDMPPATAIDGVHEVTREAYLEIIRLSFREDNKWTFSDGAGGTLQADIQDQDFLERINRHESFGKGDQLKVLLRTKTIRLPNGKYQAEHTIVKVLDHIVSPQTDMFKP